MRNAQIDRLRGIAILAVLIGHSPRFIGQWQPVLPFSLYEHVVTGAYYGVTIFFVISGYLITSKFVHLGADELSADIRQFYLNRIGRVIPPLALLLSVSVMIAIAQGGQLHASPKTRKLFITACLIIVAGYLRRNEHYGDVRVDYLHSF
jgi:peptidoglycan/LPS O-acetylase OafA/YrhL